MRPAIGARMVAFRDSVRPFAGSALPASDLRLRDVDLRPRLEAVLFDRWLRAFTFASFPWNVAFALSRSCCAAASSFTRGCRRSTSCLLLADSRPLAPDPPAPAAAPLACARIRDSLELLRDMALGFRDVSFLWPLVQFKQNLPRRRIRTDLKQSLFRCSRRRGRAPRPYRARKSPRRTLP